MTKEQHSTSPVIVQILPALNFGGVERGTLEIAEAVISKGWRAVVISSGGLLVPQLERMGAVHHQLAVDQKNPLHWPFLRRRLRALLLAEQASVVHVRSRVPAWLALGLAKSLKIPSVATIHGKFQPASPFKKFYNGKMLEADQVIAISDYVKSVITTHYGQAAKSVPIKTIHRGVDISMFDPARVSQQRIINEMERIGLPDDMPVVMLPGRPASWKGHQALLRAASLITDLSFSIVLLGAGDGKPGFVAELEKLAVEVGLGGRVRIAEASRDVPAALMLADVVAMPSVEPEPFGRVAVEAQAMGRPVIAFDMGGAAESILPGETGWLAPPADISGLADALRSALQLGPVQRRKLAARATLNVCDNFTTQKMCRRTIAVYRALLS